MFADLSISAASGLVLISMGALDLVGTIGTVRLPSIQQRIFAKGDSFRKGVEQADTRIRTVDGFLPTVEAVVDDGGALWGSGHISIYFLILTEGGGDEWPLGRVGLKLCLVLYQTSQVQLFDLKEAAKEVPLHEDEDDLLVDLGQILEAADGAGSEDLMVGDESA